MPRPVKSHMIRGKRVRVKFCAVPRQYYGYVEGNCIHIKRGLRGVNRLDTIIHECLHKAYPDMSEDAVNEGATDFARLLWRLGYRDTNMDEREE